MKSKKIILIILGIVLFTGIFIASKYYRIIKGKSVTRDAFLYIPTNSDFDDILQIVDPYIKNKEGFIWVAEKKNYPKKIRAGKYRITEGMSNEELVDHLRGGKPETVKLSFNNQDNFKKLAGRIAEQIEADSVSVLNSITDEEFLSANNFKLNTGLAMYIPNSYEFYWNTSAEEFRERMLKEYNRFWNEERTSKAREQNLTLLQVNTLASIVQKETSNVGERPRVAGLYLNRLKIFMPLQADPTIIFAIKQKYGEHTDIKRVLNKDLTIDSPYNTYTNFGLPPGPIGMPDISSIDAVLNPEKHQYYYMCASVENLGKHEFAKTLEQHNKNARKYQNWIDKQGILR